MTKFNDSSGNSFFLKSIKTLAIVHSTSSSCGQIKYLASNSLLQYYKPGKDSLQASVYPESQPGQDGPFCKPSNSAFGSEQSEAEPSALFAEGSPGVREQTLVKSR